MCSLLVLVALIGAVISAPGCDTSVRPGSPAGRLGEVARVGDEMVVAGELYHTGTRVVLWCDEGGLDGYAPPPPVPRGEEPSPGFQVGARRVSPPPGSSSTQPVELKNPDAEALRGVVDQFVLHFDGSGVSERCYVTLQRRGLSVHFMLDVDGTIYQAVDLKERAFHATTSNSRSVGVEIANIGAYPPASAGALEKWYVRDSSGVRLVPPPHPKLRPPPWPAGFVARPARQELVAGKVHGVSVLQYDYTPEQYAALSRLTAALSVVFPKLRCDYPRDGSGGPRWDRLSDDELASFSGVLGHYHIQSNKVDPGPAMDWEKMVGEARRLRTTPGVGAAAGAAK